MLLGKRLIHDGADCRGAAPALGAAAEGAIDLGRRAGAIRARVEARTHRAIGEDIAGANDHEDLQFGVALTSTCSRHVVPMRLALAIPEYS